jgi:uncharacterized protein RhaS with RHS repeats
MNARYYDPEMGRFLSEDPLCLGGGDLTLYSYAGNKPVVFVDPSGLCASSGGIGTYGNYGGPGWGDPTGATSPTDIFDAQYRTHDLDYGQAFDKYGKHYFNSITSPADVRLINNLDRVLSISPSNLTNPPDNYLWAATYARAAQTGFTVKVTAQNVISNTNAMFDIKIPTNSAFVNWIVGGRR